MYICPTCGKEFPTEEKIKKHSLACWRKANPHYKSKTPPQGETIITKKVDNNILDFFNSLRKDEQYDSKD